MKTEKVNLGGRMCIPLSRNFVPRGNSVYILFISSKQFGVFLTTEAATQSCS